jgi:UDP-N-acetylglucosamine acyltransferase
MTRIIHPTAVIAAGAEIGSDVEIGPYTVIGAGVRIGDRTRIGPQVVIDGVTTIGEDNQILGQASLGGAPQDLSYKGEPTQLEIGSRNTIREFVTINRGTVKGGGITRIGSDCLLMACCHVAHDCHVRDRVILGNNVLLAGHVWVGDRANISGAAAAHHFVTIGQMAYVGGLTRMVQDVPPFMILEGHPSRVRGVNQIGLQRAGISEPEIEELLRAFRSIYRSGEPRRGVLQRLRESELNGCVGELVQHLEHTELGAKGRYRESLREEFLREGRRRIFGETA